MNDSDDTTPVVVLYGSKGAAQAVRQFFEAVPASCEWIFILHLPPDQEEKVAAVLQSVTTRPIVPLTLPLELKPNQIYQLAQPDMKSNGGRDRINGSSSAGTLKRSKIDQISAMVADRYGSRTAVVVLSGNERRRTFRGIKRVKDQGGIAIAQDPGEAEFGELPRSAIATGIIDWVLPMTAMQKQLQAYYSPDGSLQSTGIPLPPADGNDSGLKDILSYLRTWTDRDFSCYKPTTLRHRVTRRLKLNGLKDLPGYLMYLRTHPNEVSTLLKELSLSVTNFFQDRDAFVALESSIPQLFAGKTSNDTIRVWIPGCGTGEEAYSVAILLQEHAKTLPSSPAFQIFATDNDGRLIQMAREGFFTAAIAEEISEERRRRCFIAERGGYRICRTVRDIISFTTQDLLRESPFAHLDLISCRNLLVYLNKDAQQKAAVIFHFALNPNGLLILGSADVIDDCNELFVVVNQRDRLYRKRPAPRLPSPAVPKAELTQRAEKLYRLIPPPVLPNQVLQTASKSAPFSDLKIEMRPRWDEVHFKLLEQFGPPSLIINRKHEVLHSTQNASTLLRMHGGEPSLKILELIHPAIHDELRAVLFTAEHARQPTQSMAFADLNGQWTGVTIRAVPIDDVVEGGMLLMFDRRRLEKNRPEVPVQYIAPVDRSLESEFECLTKQLRDKLAQHDLSAVQLKVSNEELETINEELRVVTVELQSMNDELDAINRQLKLKNQELGTANSVLQNLMAATSIATIFLDRQLCITKFTPLAMDLFSLIPVDIGRPLENLNHKLLYPELFRDVNEVLKTSLPIETEIDEVGGRRFLARILPYQTTDGIFAGVVLNFIDITRQYQAEQALKQNEERLREINLELDERVQMRTRELLRSEAQLRETADTSERRAAQLQSLTNELMTAEHRERRRIAMVLHDHIQQILVAARMQVHEIERQRSKSEREDAASKVTTMIDDTIDAIRTLSVALVPPLLYDEGLVATLEWLSERTQEQHRLQVIVEATSFVDTISPESRDLLFQAVRELLLNIIKHAKAKCSTVRLSTTDDGTVLEVIDAGCGFDLAHLERKQPTFGLFHVRERIEAVGGTCSIDSAIGTGTRVVITLPTKASVTPLEIDCVNEA